MAIFSEINLAFLPTMVFLCECVYVWLCFVHKRGRAAYTHEETAVPAPLKRQKALLSQCQKYTFKMSFPDFGLDFGSSEFSPLYVVRVAGDVPYVSVVEVLVEISMFLTNVYNIPYR